LYINVGFYYDRNVTYTMYGYIFMIDFKNEL